MKLQFRSDVSDRDRRHAAYLAKVAAARWKLVHLWVVNAGLPALALVCIAAGGGARSTGLLIGALWLGFNRWVDPIWRWRLRSMRRKSPGQFASGVDVTLSDDSARFETEGATSEIAWDRVYRLASVGRIVVLAHPQGVGLPMVCGLDGPSPDEVVAFVEAQTQLRCWRPSPVGWLIAVGPW